MINTSIATTPILSTVDPSFVLHKHWRLCLNYSDNPEWERGFLQMLVVKYPELLPMALGLEKSRNGCLPSRSMNYLHVEELCFRWKMYQTCKELSGCMCPPAIAQQFD